MKGTAAITVHVVLYGSIAEYGGGTHIADLYLKLGEGSLLGDVLTELGIPSEEKGYVFLNSVLCDAPGLNASAGLTLKQGDHVGVFSKDHMWPYQYRDGIRMSDTLREVMQERGAMHHTYGTTPQD